MNYYVDERVACEYCDGTGTLTETEWEGGYPVPVPAECQYCHGTGTITRELLVKDMPVCEMTTSQQDAYRKQMEELRTRFGVDLLYWETVVNTDDYLEHHERQRDRLLDYVTAASWIARMAPRRVVRDLVTDAYWILESDREAGKSVLSSGELKDRLKQIARERYAGNQVILIIVQILLPILVQLILEWWQSRLAEPKEENHGDQRRDD